VREKKKIKGRKREEAFNPKRNESYLLEQSPSPYKVSVHFEKHNVNKQ
jgi:hypothetical protein